MPGTNGGTGKPLFFKCKGCRKALVQSIALTGSKKAIDDGKASGRSTNFNRQYTCTKCGYVGWSRHKDLEHKENEPK